MTVCLLDVNVLLAFCDRHHIHHEAAHRWFTREDRQWAACPLTENGFLRILGKPGYPNYPGNLAEPMRMLLHARSQPGFHFWPDSASISEMIFPEAVLSPGQITDVYLLGLAVKNGGKLATFDRKIPVQAVAGGAKALELLG